MMSVVRSPRSVATDAYGLRTNGLRTPVISESASDPFRWQAFSTRLTELPRLIDLFLARAAELAPHSARGLTAEALAVSEE